jgi:hypothetical protein
MTGLGSCSPTPQVLPLNLWEVSFRAQFEYPFIEVSQRNPDTALSLWCIWERELLRVPTLKKAVLEDV